MDDDGVWRDEKRLPLIELSRATAVYSNEGQVDDPTGGDASAEEEYGDELRGVRDEPPVEPDPTSEEGRRHRPSPDGPLGPM